MYFFSAENLDHFFQIINGSPLPPNIIEEPSSSFDEDGRYRPDGSTLPAVEVGEPTQDESKVQVPPVGETPAVSAAPSTGDQDIAKHRHPYSNDVGTYPKTSS